MKKNWQKYMYLTLFGFYLISCRDEREQDLSFAFGNLKKDQIVWNSIKIDFITPSSFGNGTIELKIDGHSIGNVSQPPFQFTWNTHSQSEGTHQLVAVATSGDGIKQQIEQDVIVRNKLLTFNVAPDQIPVGLRAFIFLSDASGRIIAQSEFKNGDHIELAGSEAINDETFLVNEAYLAYPNYLQVYSVSEIARGTWSLNVEDKIPSYVGSIELKSQVTNSFFYVSACGGDSDYIRENSGNILLATTISPGRLFLRQLNTPDNKYALLKNVKAGTSLSFPVDEIITPLKSIELSLSDPKFISARVKLFGFPQTENYSEYYPLGDFLYNTKEIKIEYPDKEFASIGSESYYRNKQIRLYSFQPDKINDFRTVRAEIELSSSDNKIVDLATFGDFDMYAATWFYFDEYTRGYGSWMLIGPPNRSQRLRLPDLPAEIIQLVPSVKTEELSFTGAIQVSEFTRINGYSDYTKMVAHEGIAGPYKFGNAWKEQIFTETGFTGGRISAVEVPMLVEKLKIVK
jgi:hypothetical protein